MPLHQDGRGAGSDRLPDLFARALELDTAGRRGLLADLAAEDAELARQLEGMLEADRLTSPLDSPPRIRGTRTASGFEPPSEEPIPDRIGPYRILRELGRGGMGRVYLAEEEAEDFRRAVALKVIRRPVFDDDAIRRFRDEVRILASLEHPGIARFFDGGRAPDGTWFLALEYVEGEDLLDFVSRRGLDTRARVELVLQVLDAVEFAHRRLVVHRDLKPGNVLVSAEGRAKLLDFGVSKILDPERGTDVTRTELRALTPAYASPEQLRGERVTTSTDVYSLGVMLYEALAGRRPFARSEAVRGPLAELSRAWVEREPEPPSTAARQAPAPAGTAEATTLPRWRDLVGDLDAITLKALRPEPESRYPSVAAMAEDLRRWLAGRPVEARRGGRRYRLAKFVRRHRLPVGLATLTLLALVAGLAGTLVQSRRVARAAAMAQAERDFALRQLTRAEAINDLNSFLLTDAAPVSKPFTVGDLLGRAERIIGREQGWSLDNRVEILLSVGRQFERIDEVARARRLIDEAYSLSRRSTDPATRANASCALGHAESLAGRFDRAEALFAEAMAALRNEPQLLLHRVSCLLVGSEIARYGEQPARAVERVEAAGRLLRESGQGSALLAARVAMDLAESRRKADDLLRANAAFEDAYRRLTALGFAETETAGTLLNNWGLVLYALGRPLEAERLFRRSVEISSADGGGADVSPMLLTNLARALLELGRVEEAGRYAERAEAESRRTDNQLALGLALVAHALVELRRHDAVAAGRVLGEIERRFNETFPPGHYVLGILASMQGLLAEARGDLGAAAAAHDRAVAIVDASPQRVGALPVLLLRRSALALRQGAAARAQADAALALELERKARDPGSPSCRVGLAELALGRALAAKGREDEAKKAFAAALAELEPTLGGDHAETRAARELSDRANAASPASR